MAEEGCQGDRRLGENGKEIGYHAQLALDAIKQGALFVGCGFHGDFGNPAHV